MNSSTQTMRFLLATLLSFVLQPVVAQQYFTSPGALESAINGATSGGVFIVTDGTYNDFEVSVENMSTSTNPIVIKAETVGGVTLTGESQFVFKKSAHITLEGFVFDCTGDETLVKLEGCNNIRISRNVFELSTTESIKWVFIGGVWNDNTYPFQYPSHHNTIDHNVFQNKSTPGHYITVDGSKHDDGTDEVYYQSQYDVIAFNHFKNNGPRAVNEQESIRVGWSEMSLSSGYTTVEHNLFEDCDGDPEIVSVKSCDNTIRHNTFRKSYGTLSLRHGNRNKVEGNFFFGDNKAVGTSPAGSTLYTGGIRIYGTDHVIINNYMEGLNGTRWDAPITLTLGDAIDGQSSSLSKHFRAERVMIAYNTLVNNDHGIEIGYDNNNNYSKDLEDITITNNIITGSENAMVDIVDPSNDQGSEIHWIQNIFYPTGNAVVLAGASTTSFDTTEVKNIDPQLSLNATAGFYKATSTTPTWPNIVAAVSVPQDIEGQTRSTSTNPGADHFSSSAVFYGPLTAADVGPSASGPLSSVELDLNSTLSVFPNPASQTLTVNQLPENASQISLYSLQGNLVKSVPVGDGSTTMDLQVDTLPTGMYLLSVTHSQGSTTQRVVITH